MNQPIKTTASTQATVVQLGKKMNEQFLERQREVNALLVAALSQEHVCFLGIAGTGKSAMLMAFAHALSGARTFETLLNKFSVPEQLVGPLKLSALDDDRYERNTQNTILDCEMAFVDEVFKGNAAVQNLLLPVMNERKFHNGQHVMKLPLRLMVAASNEMPDTGAGLEACWDRYLLREVVAPIASEDNRLALLTRAASGQRSGISEPMLSLEQWDAACDEVKRVKCDERVLRTVLGVRRQLESDGIAYGDRRWVKAVRVLQANAYLSGGSEVEDDHVEILESVLWNSPEQRDKVRTVLSKCIAPQISESRKIADAALADANKQASSGATDDQYKAMTILKNAGTRAKSLQQQTKVGSRAHTRIGEMMAEMRTKFLEYQKIITGKHSVFDDDEAKALPAGGK